MPATAAFYCEDLPDLLPQCWILCSWNVKASGTLQGFCSVEFSPFPSKTCCLNNRETNKLLTIWMMLHQCSMCMSCLYLILSLMFMLFLQASWDISRRGGRYLILFLKDCHELSVADEEVNIWAPFRTKTYLMRVLEIWIISLVLLSTMIGHKQSQMLQWYTACYIFSLFQDFP